MSFVLKKSSRKDKKFMLITPEKKIHFGGAGYSDFTIHKDEERKKNYILRHKKNENWDEINAGSLSRWILWNKETLEESVKDFELKFKKKIIISL